VRVGVVEEEGGERERQDVRQQSIACKESPRQNLGAPDSRVPSALVALVLVPQPPPTSSRQFPVPLPPAAANNNNINTDADTITIAITNSITTTHFLPLLDMQ
jgi:hypothetical protein